MIYMDFGFSLLLLKQKSLDLYRHANCVVLSMSPPRWCLHLIVVKRFEYVSDPESYTSCSIATGRTSLAGQVKV